MRELRPINPTPASVRALAAMTPRTLAAILPRHPTREHIAWVVNDEAEREGESPSEVLGSCMRADLVRARYRAILRILDESGCSILGLSRVWGLDRRSIQRAIMLAARDGRLDPYRLRSERRAA